MIKKKNKAFTLMEMLVVIIIIGIILAIVLPNVTTLVNNRSRKMYETHVDVVVKSAAYLYKDQYRGELSDGNAECFNINYQTLLSDGLIQETEVFCKGNIILSRKTNSSGMEPSYYLTCTDSKGNIISKSEKTPSGCRGFNGRFKMEYEIYEDSNKEKSYDGNYYVKNAYVYFNSTSPYAFEISHYEYATGLDGTWKEIKSGSNLGSIDDTKNLVGNLYVRAVDEDGNESSSVEIPVKMDNTGPTFNTSVTGDWLTKTLTISNVVDQQVGTLAELAYSFDGGETWQEENTQDYIENKTATICTRDILGNKTCKIVVVSGIDRVIPNPPTVTASDSITSGNWHNSDFTLTLSGANNISGNTYYWGETNNPTTEGTSISITEETKSKLYYMKVCSGAGFCSEVTSYEVKLDKSTPAAPVIKGGNSNWVSLPLTISIQTPGTAFSGVKHYEYYISPSSKTPSSDVKVTGTTSGNVTINAEGTNYIWYRTVSNSGLRSEWSNSQVSNFRTTGTLRSGPVYGSEFWQYRSSITKIIFQNKLSPIAGLESWDISEEKNGGVMAYYDSSTNTVYIQGNGKIIANRDSSYLFDHLDKLTTIEGLEYLDTSNVTNMDYMFLGCSSLRNLNISNWNTSNVETMKYMFRDCSSLTSIDLNKWNTYKVKNMSFMFADCSSLTTLNISNWDTSNVRDMNDMFLNCSSLTTLNISNWNISEVKYMNNMFYKCIKLTTTITIRQTMGMYYDYMFYSAATESGAKITVNYTSATSTLVDKMIATAASTGGNVVKGSLVN